jgi:multidrug resistance efflux pump
MTWANRFRLFLGLVVVVVIVAASTLFLSVRETNVASSTASVKAISYSVGSDYAGTVVSEKIKVGDTVKKGERLLTVQSAAVATAAAQKGGIPASSSYVVAPGGLLTLIATQPGMVASLGANLGGFVSGGSRLASIDKTGSLYVSAHFHIDAYDFSRIEKGAIVDLVLPNQRELTGKVYRLTVTTTKNGEASVTATIHSSALVLGKDSGLVSPGTPIAANLHLRDSGPLGGLREMFTSLLEKMHL